MDVSKKTHKGILNGKGKTAKLNRGFSRMLANYSDSDMLVAPCRICRRNLTSFSLAVLPFAVLPFESIFPSNKIISAPFLHTGPVLYFDST